MNRTLFRALAAVAVLAAAPLAAQSDPTGTLVTGSGIAGYPVIPVRDLEGALFRRVDGGTAFRTREVADAMLGEAAEAQRAACAATLQKPPHWPDSLSLDPAAQRAVCGLLARRGLDGDDARRVLHALRGGQPGTENDAAQQLVAALAGLGEDVPGYLDARQRYVNGTRWEAAIRAYMEYLRTVPDALMDPPPSELVTIAALLDRVVDAGLAASGR
jgi:predicted outer membrane protein